MKEKEIKHIGLRVSPEIHKKLAYIARYDGRTVNGLALYLLNRCVRDFEKEHGPITPEDLEQ